MKQKAAVRRFLHLLAIDLTALLLIRTLLGAAGCFPERPESSGAVQPVNVSAQPPAYLPVLMYHSVRRGPESDYAVTPDTLEADFLTLLSFGWETVSPEQLIRFVRDGMPLPEKPVLLTFDDGFYNSLSYVLPLLEKYDLCATVNVVGSFTTELAEADSHQPAYSYLTADDLRKLQQSGRISFGNHTNRMHSRSERQGCAIMPGESERDYHALLYADLAAVQELFERTLHEIPVVFAYPYGFYCPESEPVLKQLGFAVTLSCTEGINCLTDDPDCLYGLRRYNRSGNLTTEAFMSRIGQAVQSAEVSPTDKKWGSAPNPAKGS